MSKMTFFDDIEPLTFDGYGMVRLPAITLTPEERATAQVKPGASNKDYLKALVWSGFKAKAAKGLFKDNDEKALMSRLKMEFEVFEKTGTIDYLLLVWDILKWCDQNKISRGPGRGSVAGSFALYCLGLTGINSVKHKLNFTRFISEARAKPKFVDGVMYVSGKTLMDIDNDISFAGRSRVLDYIAEKHKGRTCMISNRLQLTGKMALKDTLKTYLGYNEEQAKKVTDHFDSKFGKIESIEDAFNNHDALIRWMDESPQNKRAVEIAKGLEGLNVSKGQHASGVFICYHELDGHIPVELGKTKQIVTSFDMEVAAEMGCKIDILGLRTVDVIDEACRAAGLDREMIDVEHQSIYDYFKATDLYYGLFQIEDGLTKQYTQKVSPRHADDLAAVLALSRPGSLKYVDDFVSYVKDGAFKPIYPAIDEILASTGNIILYQEQINDVCQKVYGLSAVDADDVRRAIGKKVKEDMAKWEPELYKRGTERDIPETVTKYFWDTCNASADYLFNASHAYSYAYLSALTTYLKANHLKEFMLALLRMSQHETKPQEVISRVIQESRQLGVNVLPPDLSRSQADFTFEGNDIRFGLCHIRGISDHTIHKLLTFKRGENKFQTFEAAQQAGLNIAVLTGLIYCGCIESNVSRAKLALEAQSYNLLTDREKPIVHKMGPEFNYDLLAIIKEMTARKNDKGKPLMAEKRFGTFKKAYEPYKAIYIENSRNEDLCSYVMECHFLGFSYSRTLRGIFERRGVVGLVDLAELNTEPDDTRASFVAVVGEIERKTSRSSNNPYLKIVLFDDSGSIEAFVFGQQRIDQLLKAGRLPEEGDIVTVQGKKKGISSVYIDAITLQSNFTVLKKSELPAIYAKPKEDEEA